MSYDPEHHLVPWSGLGVSLVLWAFGVAGLLVLGHGTPPAAREPWIDGLAAGPRCGPAAAGPDHPSAGEARVAATQVRAS